MVSGSRTGLGRAPGSMVNMISFSPAPENSSDDDGDNMTLGMRWCLFPPCFERASGWRVPDSNGPGLGINKGSGEDASIGDADTGGVGTVVVAVAVVFQSYPGFTIRLIASPSLILLYSLSSFPSASAFPLNKSRWESAGGAEGSAASCVFIAEIVSVGLTLIEKVACGLSDLNTREMEAKDRMWPSKCLHQHVEDLQQDIGNETNLMKIQMAGVEVRVRGVAAQKSSDINWRAQKNGSKRTIISPWV